MPVNINDETNSGGSIELQIVTPNDRKRSVNLLVQAISSACDTTLNDILQYNLMQHSKIIEKFVYDEMQLERDYFPLIAEMVEEIQTELRERIRISRELARNIVHPERTQPVSIEGSQEWRQFYSSTLRRAVINTFIKDIQANINVPPRFKMGLMIGVEAMEHFAYKEAKTKLEYFKIIERRKAEITTELIEYFESENVESD